jgi:SHS2 domain-containing protein
MLPHTADAKAAIDAPDLWSLYADAVAVVRALLVGTSSVEGRQTVVVEPDDEDDAERFFRFVRELLYRHDVDTFVPAELVGMAPPVVAGETFDPTRHVIEHGVKALTRHQFRFDTDADGHHVELVFDL